MSGYNSSFTVGLLLAKFLIVKLLPVLESFGSGTGSASYHGVNDVMMIYLPRVILDCDMNYGQNFDRKVFFAKLLLASLLLETCASSYLRHTVLS